MQPVGRLCSVKGSNHELQHLRSTSKLLKALVNLISFDKCGCYKKVRHLILYLNAMEQCESTIVCGVPIFMVFCGFAKPWNLVPNGNEISLDVLIENLKTTNLRIFELIFLPLSTKIGIHQLKYFHSICCLWSNCCAVAF